ncbi:MAG: MFS transporter [Syntrophales bacterium]|nr:MFS transporter [Syntrophales bacterium]MCK9527909.1 MFS transporter [Syntrophales bacterium]MDX9921915.1 MFS transporter [Syntrophales bacterium]
MSSLARLFPALGDVHFRALWLGMLPGILAMQMFFFVNGYFAFQLTGAASSIGIIWLGFGIPNLLFALPGGVVADHYSKRRVLLITQVFLMGGAVVTALLVLTGAIMIWHMVLIGTVMGTAFTFHMPARQSFSAQLVTPAYLMNAMALNGAGLNVCRLLGPPLAAVLIGISWINVGGTYVIMAVMFALVIFSLFRITHSGSPDGGKKTQTGFRSMIDGILYIRHNSVVLILLIMSLAPIMLGLPYQALMPVFAERVFFTGPRGLGMLMMANGVGAMAGSLIIASLRELKNRGLVQIGLGILFGLSLALFSLVTSYVLALAVLFVVGIASSSYLALNATLIMENSDRGYHGRVMSIYMLTFSALPLGNAVLSVFADSIGAPATVGIGGLLLAGTVFIFGRLSRSYRAL